MVRARAGILVSVPDEPARTTVLEQLRRRYGADYDVFDEPDLDRAHDLVTALASGDTDEFVTSAGADDRARGARPPHTAREIALVIARRSAADPVMPDPEAASAVPSRPGAAAPDRDSGDDPLFVHARALFPDVRRLLLIDWGSWALPETAETVSQLMARTMIDYYLVVPSRDPDESFHRGVTDLLLDWERAAGRAQTGFAVIGDSALPRTHALRILLTRGGAGAELVAPASERAVELGAGPDRADLTLPAVRLPDGRLLSDPDDATLASAYGLTTDLPRAAVDLVVIGAGPGGLAAAVYAASEGLSTLVLEAESIGGQAGSSSLIRNYLGFPRGTSGADLAQRAYQQAWAFGARFAHARRATGLAVVDDGFAVEIGDEARVRAGAVVVASGVTYRRLAVPQLAPFVGVSVFYGATAVEAKAQQGKAVVVVGGGNSAGQAALHLSRYAASVALVVRGSTLAESMSQYLVDELAAGGVAIITRSRVVGAEAAAPPAEPLLESIVLQHADGSSVAVPCQALFITIGARPHTEWLPDEVLRDQWGSVITGHEVVVEGGRRAWARDEPPAPLESSVPGLFAVGDVRRGSVKRVASAVGEGSVVISSVHEHLGRR
ncbi:FAD-dependent oxidoreductase [Herbiconiux daphne]|uniref:FAD-dependent oxidoreductase n=1 Tax=Herbiconiux daphne TaxID=2970914 RepID=A0ABT2H188_9MICO|nr:FAD-dependent oxidoreductase [Herbiconiux daphne]MCS5733709.1 FAD-dependent oxidoreductase [Herbiconiux daphne]